MVSEYEEAESYQQGSYDRSRDAYEDEWECEFGERCLMPGYFHRRDECHTVEMAEQWADEQNAWCEGCDGGCWMCGDC